jgi:hypothetical protein
MIITALAEIVRLEKDKHSSLFYLSVRDEGSNVYLN